MNSNNHSVFDMKFHWVLVTKYGNKCFTKGILHSLESICMSHCAKWGVQLLEFGGESDHMHLMIELNPTIEPSNMWTLSSIMEFLIITLEPIKQLSPIVTNSHIKEWDWTLVFFPIKTFFCISTNGPIDTSSSKKQSYMLEGLIIVTLVPVFTFKILLWIILISDLMRLLNI